MSKVLEVLELDCNIVRQAGSLHVLSGYGHRRTVVVIAIGMVQELALLRVVVVNLVKQFGIEIGPTLECEALAEHAGGDIASYQRCLNGQCAASAHGVDKVGLAAPTSHQDDTSRKHFIQWCLNGLLPVTSAMKTLS